MRVASVVVPEGCLLVGQAGRPVRGAEAGGCLRGCAYRAEACVAVRFTVCRCGVGTGWQGSLGPRHPPSNNNLPRSMRRWIGARGAMGSTSSQPLATGAGGAATTAAGSRSLEATDADVAAGTRTPASTTKWGRAAIPVSPSSLWDSAASEWRDESGRGRSTSSDASARSRITPLAPRPVRTPR